MITELTEEDMRSALFGTADSSSSAHTPRDLPVVSAPGKGEKRRALRSTTPKLKVTLCVGNEFEGDTQSFVYEADTLSRLQAELDAIKAARKKFKYIELVSITST